jgi:transcriptional regulator with XRE-family HTH domain
MMDLADYIGEKLRTARKETGLTQRELADRVGISTEGYGHYERSIRTPSIEMLLRISEILERPITYFLPGVEETSDLRFDPQFRTIARAWPHLPAPIKEAIMIIARSVLDQSEVEVDGETTTKSEIEKLRTEASRLRKLIEQNRLTEEEQEMVAILRSLPDGVRDVAVKMLRGLSPES